MTEDRSALVGLTTQIVSAYLEANLFPAAEIPQLIRGVHGALITLGGSPTETPLGPSRGKLTPAQIRKSITADWLISFEDGRSYKTLKRHLAVRGLTLDEYRAKWGLPDNYPSTAPTYSAQRSALAKTVGLGQLRSRSKKPPPPSGRRPSKK